MKRKYLLINLLALNNFLVKKLIRFLVLTLLMDLIVGSEVSKLYAQTYTWKKNVVGNWSNPSNWSPIGIPEAGDTAIISSGIVSLSEDATVGRLEHNGGTITGTGKLTVEVEIQWVEGNHSGSGVTYIPQGATMAILGKNVKAINSRILLNDGKINWLSSSLKLSEGAVLHNKGVIEAHSDVGMLRGYGAPVTFDNHATFRKSTGSGATTIAAGVTFNNSGKVQVQEGVLQIGGGKSTGSFETANGTILKFNQGGIPYILESGVTLRVEGILEIEAPLVINTDLILPAKTILKGYSIGGSGNIIFPESLEWKDGDLKGSGTVTFAVGARVELKGASIMGIHRPVINEGSVLFSGSGRLFIGKNTFFTNKGLFSLLGEGNIIGNWSIFVNASTGIFRKTVTTTVGAISNLRFENYGIVDVQSGTLLMYNDGYYCCSVYFQKEGSTILNGGILASKIKSINTGATINRTIHIEGGEVRGVGKIDAHVVNGGILSPGSASGETGVIEVTGNYTQEKTGLLRLELGGTNPGSDYDRLDVQEAKLDGTLELVQIRSFVPGKEDILYPMRWMGSIYNGNFATVEGLAFGPYAYLEYQYTNNGFSLYNHTAQQTYVSAKVVAQQWARSNQPVTITVTIRNSGSTHVLVPVTLMLDPHIFLDLSNWEVSQSTYEDLKKRISFPIPPPDPSQPYPALKRYSVLDDGRYAIPEFISLPPNSSFSIPVKTGCGANVGVNIGSPIDWNQLNSCGHAAASILLDWVPGHACVKNALKFVNAEMRCRTLGICSDLPAYFLNLTLWSYQCAASFIKPIQVIEKIIKINQIFSRTNNIMKGIEECGKFFLPLDIKALGRATCALSSDPNEKVGPSGIAKERYISKYDSLHYTIFFENKPSATAPAQDVVITDTIDIAKYDVATFSFGPITFGSNVLVVPNNLQSFYKDFYLPDSSLIVRLNANLNPNTGLITWQFASLDPDTGQPTDKPLAGFLPPNKVSPEGEGSVSYSVKLQSSLTTKTIFGSAARIVFDTNEPLDTHAWINTLDATPPESSILPIELAPDGKFNVRWKGTDMGSGIKNYTIYVSHDNSEFKPWLTAITDTIAHFTGDAAISYAFYSIAEDYVGNRENAPDTADVVTKIKSAIPDGKEQPTKCILFQNFPNPFQNQTTIRFGLKEQSYVQLIIYDLLGHEVHRLLSETKSKGWHEVIWNGDDLRNILLPAGLYVYQLKTNNYTAAHTLVIVR